jgi:hypothetical protein
MSVKKIYFVCAPIFMYWPVEMTKLMAKKSPIISGGFIGGPKKYYEILLKEWGGIADNVVYTHEIEVEWVRNPFKQEDLVFFQSLLGDKILNELIIADRHVGNGLLFGGSISNSNFLAELKSDKNSYLNYTVNMLRYLYDFLQKNKPDLFYSYAVAGAFTLGLAELCSKLNIPFYKLTHSRIQNLIVLDTSPKDEMNIVREKFNSELSGFQPESLKWAENYLNDFRLKQAQPDYQILQNEIYSAKTKLKYSLKNWAKYLKGLVDKSNDFTHNSYLDNLKYDQKTVKGIKEFWRKKPFFPTEDLIKRKFLFYTLHVDPEASTMVISPYQTNQLSVIEALAKSKPIDQILIVKEHLTMIGRRPEGFYDKINALPGVYLVDPREPSFKFINDAEAIVTLTGTSGFEAVMLKKPAIFLGNFIYKFIEDGFALTNDLSALPDILNNVQNLKPASDENIIRLLAAIKEVSFPFNGGLIWSGVSKERVLENPDVVKLFADKFEEILS